MNDKSGNEIHEAYMKGLFEGKKLILDLIGESVNDELAELRKQAEAQE